MVDEIITNLVKTIVKEYLNTEGRKQIDELLKSQKLSPVRLEQDVPKMYASCKELCQIFGIGKSKVYKDVQAMECDPKYSQFVRQTSSKCKEISVYGFNKYREEMAKKYLR